MKRICKVIVVLLSILTTINFTSAYFITEISITDETHTKGYKISIDGNGGVFKNSAVIVSNNSTTLPIPIRNGYTFNGYSNTFDGKVLYSHNINNIDDINNNQIYAIWDINSYIVDVNPIIDGITYSTGLAGFSFEVWVNNELVSENAIDWYQSVSYGDIVRVKTHAVIGRTTNFDKTIIVGTNNINLSPNWTTNNYEGHFYLNGTHRLTTYNKYGSTISTPNTNAGALGYDPNFYYISGFTPWVTWIQPEYAVGFSINIAEYNCWASFGSATSSNAVAQNNKLISAGYNFCTVDKSAGSVSCYGNASKVIALYNNVWNILPKSGSGYSIYKSTACDSGWSHVQRR